MHIHWFQHDHYEDLAYIGQWASESGHTSSVTRFDIDPILPDLDTIDWLIVMGGKMGTYEETEFPWLVDEKKYIKKAIDKGKVVIGICLGSQLVAASLGARVYRNEEPEIGFFPVHFNDFARKDHVFQHFPEMLTVLHIHNDTFDLPVAATLMASSEATPNQAFRFGKNVFAFQFHFEVTSACLPIFFNGKEERPSKGKWIQEDPLIIESAQICDSNNLIFSKVLDAIALLKKQ
jgi:GMP synthase-like glutamine amidotransferase